MNHRCDLLQSWLISADGPPDWFYADVLFRLKVTELCVSVKIIELWLKSDSPHDSQMLQTSSSRQLIWIKNQRQTNENLTQREGVMSRQYRSDRSEARDVGWRITCRWCRTCRCDVVQIRSEIRHDEMETQMWWRRLFPVEIINVRDGWWRSDIHVAEFSFMV